MAADTHPPLFELEAHHVGEGRAETAAHLAGCAPCRAYLDELATGAAAFATTARPEEFVRAVAARGERRRVAWRWLLPALALAGAAGLWLLVPRAPERAADVILEKGAPRVTVILLHEGQQTRHSDAVDGQPGDSVRVELALVAPRELEVVLLEEDGTLTPLSPPRRFEAGTHLLQPAFSFDARPTRARLLVGPPAGVARVRAGQPAPEVVMLPVRAAGGAR